MKSKKYPQQKNSPPAVNPLPLPKLFAVAATFLVLAVLVYGNSFSGQFVLDDYAKITMNPLIKKLWPLGSVFEGSNRPLVYLTFVVNYALGGMDVWGYHFFNVTVHVMAALALFAIIRRTLSTQALRGRYGAKSLGLALAAAMLWFVHPLQTESVTYVYQRSESLMGLFYLLTLYAGMRFLERGSRGWMAGAIAFCFLGMATKAVMATAPILMLVYDRIFHAASWREIGKKRKGFYLALASSWIVVGLLVAGPQESQGTAGFDVKEVSWRGYALSQPGVIVHYLRLAFWPDTLLLDYQWPVAKDWQHIFPAAAVIGGLTALTAWALRRRPAWGFWGVWFFLILLPSSSFIPIVDLAFEHRMYLSLAAPIFLVVVWLDRWSESRRQPAWKILGIGFCIVLLSWRTVQRNKDYQSSVRMWSHVLAHVPQNPRAHYNLGLAYFREGNKDKAFTHYLEAVRLKPDYAMAHNNLGNLYFEKGRPEKSVEHFEEALRLRPDYAEAHNNFGVILMEQGRFEEAREHLGEASRLNPRDAASVKNMGNLFYLQGNRDAAVAKYRETLRINPDHTYAHNTLGMIFLEQKKYDLAREEFIQILRREPNNPEAHNHLGVVMLQQGDFERAVVQFRQALWLKNDYETARRNLAMALSYQKQTQGN